MGYEIDDFENVKKQQNISVKFSPVDLDLELITKFSVNKTLQKHLKVVKKCKSMTIFKMEFH
jgi:hypothetical protein